MISLPPFRELGSLKKIEDFMTDFILMNFRGKPPSCLRYELRLKFGRLDYFTQFAFEILNDFPLDVYKSDQF